MVKIVQDENYRDSLPVDLVDDDVQQSVEWLRLLFLEHAQQIWLYAGDDLL